MSTYGAQLSFPARAGIQMASTLETPHKGGRARRRRARMVQTRPGCRRGPVLDVVSGPPRVRGPRGEQYRQLCDDPPWAQSVPRPQELWPDAYVSISFVVSVADCRRWTPVSTPYSFSCKRTPKDAEDQLEAALGAAKAITQVHGTAYTVHSCSWS